MSLIPNPIDTSDVELSGGLEQLTEQKARNVTKTGLSDASKWMVIWVKRDNQISYTSVLLNITIC